MALLEQLKDFGLNESEAKVYLYLLEEGQCTPPKIAKGVGIIRTNSYNVLETLRNMGLVEEHLQGKRKAYLAADPTSLLRSVEQKKETLERLLPDLRALHTVQKNKPKVRFYDGWGEVKEIYLQAAEREEVFGLGSAKSISNLEKDFFAKFLKKLKSRNVIFHDILTHDSGSAEGAQMLASLGALYDYRLLPKSQGDQPTDILIWGDNVALITLAEPIFGTVLTSPLLSKTFRVIWATMKHGLEG